MITITSWFLNLDCHLPNGLNGVVRLCWCFLETWITLQCLTFTTTIKLASEMNSLDRSWPWTPSLAFQGKLISDLFIFNHIYEVSQWEQLPIQMDKGSSPPGGTSDLEVGGWPGNWNGSLERWTLLIFLLSRRGRGGRWRRWSGWQRRHSLLDDQDQDRLSGWSEVPPIFFWW